MATTYTAKYTGTFGVNTAGSDGLSTSQSGDALPNYAEIVGITYSIDMSAGGYSSSKVWRVNHFYVGSGSPYANYKEVTMTGSSQTINGSMEFESGDVSVFDGSVTLYAKVNTSHSSTSYMGSVTITVTYQLSYGRSTATLSPISLDAGAKMTVSFSNSNLSAVYHKVTWAFGEQTKTTTTSTGASSTSYTIPLSWVNEIPNALSGTGTVTVYTYASDGSQAGSSAYVFTLNVPDSIAPTISSISASRIDGAVPSSWGIYVQNRSGVLLTANGASGSYGSTISSYRFSVSGAFVQNYNAQTSNTLTISPIMFSGTQTFTVYAVDTRGRSTPSVSCTISVNAYSAPTFTEALAFRCDSNGTSNEEGVHVSACVNATYASLNGQNSFVASCYYRKLGDSEWTLGKDSMVLGTTYVLGGDLGTNYTYQVRFTLTDAFGTIEKVVDVSTSQYTMFFKKGGTGVAFGKVCENAFAVEFAPDWRILHGAFHLRPVYYSTDKNSPPSNPVEGLVWLVQK